MTSKIGPWGVRFWSKIKNSYLRLNFRKNHIQSPTTFKPIWMLVRNFSYIFDVRGALACRAWPHINIWKLHICYNYVCRYHIHQPSNSVNKEFFLKFFIFSIIEFFRKFYDDVKFLCTWINYFLPAPPQGFELSSRSPALKDSSN